MNNFPNLIKKRLLSIIKKMAADPEPFVVNPGKDFTRKRKLTFELMTRMILSMGGGSLSKELLDFFEYDKDTASTSAFVQQRDKILPSSFEYLLHEFTNTFTHLKTFRGYRLLAVDGSILHTPHNPTDASSHLENCVHSRGYNFFHLDAMYDLCNKLYIDAILVGKKKENEVGALIRMTERSNLKKVIVVADRGYES